MKGDSWQRRISGVAPRFTNFSVSEFTKCEIKKTRLSLRDSGLSKKISGVIKIIPFFFASSNK